jgi:membrane-anchored protein YejM (alkaline phosphatase superfamily)
MNTGDILAGRPSMGAWATYGLGSCNESLPAFVVLTDAREVNGGPKNWSSGFLPALYQGTQFRNEGPPIFNLALPGTVGEKQQRNKLDLLAKLNQRFAADKPEDSELAARLNSYELAWRMQSAAPEAVDLSQETEATKRLYGIGEKETDKFGMNCLLARRLVERGVRFVQCYSGSGNLWDAHSDLEGNHSKYCAQTDKPMAGLLTDLKARGLLDSTLVIWGGEFGRTPFNEKGDGRDHNPWGFSMWMAGGGIKGGTAVGATDEIGLRAVERRAHVHDIHATILHLMGLDHEKLNYLHNGRNERPTINDGEVIREALA